MKTIKLFRSRAEVKAPSGLWKSLTRAQKARLGKLGFTQQSWDNNVKESVPSGDNLFWSEAPRTAGRIAPMTGDRARQPVPYESIFRR